MRSYVSQVEAGLALYKTMFVNLFTAFFLNSCYLACALK